MTPMKKLAKEPTTIYAFWKTSKIYFCLFNYFREEEVVKEEIEIDIGRILDIEKYVLENIGKIRGSSDSDLLDIKNVHFNHR